MKTLPIQQKLFNIKPLKRAILTSTIGLTALTLSSCTQAEKEQISKMTTTEKVGNGLLNGLLIGTGVLGFLGITSIKWKKKPSKDEYNRNEG